VGSPDSIRVPFPWFPRQHRGAELDPGFIAQQPQKLLGILQDIARIKHRWPAPCLLTYHSEDLQLLGKPRVSKTGFRKDLNERGQHLRRVAEQEAVLEAVDPFPPHTGQEVMRRLGTAPFVMADIQSWILFGIGLLFSALAFADGWQFRDPYPGYAGVQARLNAAHDAYMARKTALIDTLDDIRRDYGEKLGEVSRDLSERRKDYDTIISNRQRLQLLFEQAQVNLEAAGTALLRIYHAANQSARSTPSPERFVRGFTLTRIPAAIPRRDEGDRDLLNEQIRIAQQTLEAAIVDINRAFAETVERYRQLDSLIPEAGDGTAA